jgi:hypothetical protein
VSPHFFSEAAAGPKQLDGGAKFYSPDRNTVIVYNPDQLEIRDTRTNQLYSSVTVSLLFALRWTGDSKTFVAIEHIAHGSDAIFAHLTTVNGKPSLSFRRGKGIAITE